jgi:hypothetical protein
MHTGFFDVPDLTLPVRRAARPPMRRLAAFVAIVSLCLAVDALIVFALYKAGTALFTQIDLGTLAPWGVAQIALASAVALYVVYRLLRALVRNRTPVESDADRESVGS